MKLNNYFKAFLEDTVNLNQSRLDTLDQRVAAIMRTLEADTEIGSRIQGHIRQGSWAHKTIIKPLNNHEFDADVLLLLEEVPEWTERRYLSEVRGALRRSSTYENKVRKKNRCVRVGYANECHVDVVPHVHLSDGRQVIINYAEEKFEDTNPDGFTEWMKERDTLSRSNFRKVLRLLKYLRDYKQTFTVPSVILTMLVGERITALGANERYADVPTALKTMLTDLDAWLQIYPIMPVLEDPSCPGTYFNHRWNQEQYENFRDKVALYAAWATEAFEEPDKQKSLAAWQRIFGDKFQAPSSTRSIAAKYAAETAASSAPLTRAPNEQFIEDLGFTPVLSHQVRINAVVQKKDGFRSGPLRMLRYVGAQRTLQFTISTDVPGPFDLYWKVRNMGPEADHVGQLRGELIKDNGSMSRTETTLYRGRHYIDAYIVKNSRVLAMDRHDVVIK